MIIFVLTLEPYAPYLASFVSSMKSAVSIGILLFPVSDVEFHLSLLFVLRADT